MRTSKMLNWNTLGNLLNPSSSTQSIYLSLGVMPPRPLQIRGRAFIRLRPDYLLHRGGFVQEWSLIDVGGVLAGFCGTTLKTIPRSSISGNQETWSKLMDACKRDPALAEQIELHRPPEPLLRDGLSGQADMIARVASVAAFQPEVALRGAPPPDPKREIEVLYLPKQLSVPRAMARTLSRIQDVRRYDPFAGIDVALTS